MSEKSDLAVHAAWKAFPDGSEDQKMRLADDIRRVILAHVSERCVKSPIQSGWCCPRCSRIYGPSVQICVTCNAKVASKENL